MARARQRTQTPGGRTAPDVADEAPVDDVTTDDEVLDDEVLDDEALDDEWTDEEWDDDGWDDDGAGDGAATVAAGHDLDDDEYEYYDGAAGGAAVARADGREWYGPLESIVRKPRWFVVPLVIAVVVGAGLGLVRKPTYTAESQLIVGSVVRDFQGAEGQVLAIQQLTDIYSRLVGSSDYQDKVDAARGDGAGGLTASPIPNSAIIRLEATGATQDEATALADVGAQQLAAYVGELRSDSAAASQALLDQINTASIEAAQAATAQATASANLAASTGTARTAAQQAFDQADAALTTANLKLDTLKANYTSIQDSSTGGIGVSVFAPAAPTGSDRRSTLQLYGIAAVVLGALLGTALATLAANDWRLLPGARETDPRT